MTKSLNEMFPYPLDLIVYDYYRSGISLDYREVKTLDTILWIVKWSGGFNEVDCSEIAERAIVNYGLLFRFDEREVAWAILRLLEKQVLSSVSISPAEDLPFHSSIVPAIKVVKINNEKLVADVMADDIENTIIVTIDDNPAYLEIRCEQHGNTLSNEHSMIVYDDMMQMGEQSAVVECKN